MRKKLSDVITHYTAHELIDSGMSIKFNPGRFPYFGKRLDQPLENVDDYTVDGIYLAMIKGVRCRTQNNGFALTVINGKAFVDSTYYLFSCKSVAVAHYLKQVLAHVNSTGILQEVYSSKCYVDIDRFLSLEMYVPSYEKMTQICTLFQSQEEQKTLLIKEKELIHRALNRMIEIVGADGQNEERPSLCRLGDVALPKKGEALQFNRRSKKGFPVVSSYGVVGYHSEALCDGPVVVIGRKGGHIDVQWFNDACWPTADTMYIDQGCSTLSLSFLYFLLKKEFPANLSSEKQNIEGVREKLKELILICPQQERQKELVAVSEAAKDLFVQGNKKQLLLKEFRSNFLDKLIVEGL